ncbi:pantoate--beta-alanine ligase [Haliea sp. AH-315-K21]|uniref:Pantothenate synthetase n=1 Tax=SAR86 cluster bacterium TaxID=2030880 RepID=A0A2A5CAS0_9GAMM|nr:pantoate--beta-alanine ligase [Haliea sp. AH-315-K21]MBN4075540.1 pantoate--beta-alanine ligase [Gammaproteobacteria bacterium AH-315-E17]PCJ40598.1 MAG: pantoate--beta-alanine ligase [SAR86 cluster bacterium]
MQIYRTIADLRQDLKLARDNGLSIGLVPTMGNLHEGHLSLVKMARKQCDFIVTTIFINPAQFGPNEDLQNYPRSFEDDTTALESINCDAVFAPNIEEIYPFGPRLETLVTVPSLSQLLCGASRPGHFDGVCTIVTKLFTICQPDKAYFGEKDYQQLTIIKKLVHDLNIPLEIIGIPTQRETSGLALSSRNNYLSAEQKQQAAILYQSLLQTADALKNSSGLNFAKLENKALQKISIAGLQPDYFSICHTNTLLPAKPSDTELVILTAAYLGETRLIDNISITFS